MSVLSFGAMRVPQEAGEDPEENRSRAFATMRRALDSGINHIETARAYGNSEDLIGGALRSGAIRRDEFLLTTKIAPSSDGTAFRADLEDTMARMGVDRVDNLDVHGINLPEHLDQCLLPDGCMAAIRKAMDEGLVAHVGFSTHGPLDVILSAIRSDLFESVNLHYYYFNQRNRPAVELAAEKGMGVYIISPADKGGRLFAPPDRLAELCAPYSPLGLNQRWLLAQPAVHSLSVGPAVPGELDAHLPAADRDGPLDEDEAAAVSRLDGAVSVLGDTWCSYCHECLPCPQDIQIPEVLRLRNLALTYDMTEFGEYRYNMMSHRDPESGEPVGGAGHWFPGVQGDFCTSCGDCLPRCPLHLRIPGLLQETHAMLGGEARRRLWG